MIPDAQKAASLFDRALDFEPAERAIFLAWACGDSMQADGRVDEALVDIQPNEQRLN